MNREIRVTIRFLHDEHKELQGQADIASLSLSEYVRRRVFGKKVASKVDLKVLAELRRLGGLLKHIHLETRGAYSQDTAAAIQAIEAYVRLLCRDKRVGRGEEQEEQ